MGRPILYVPGIQDMDQVETVAGVVVLGHVAKMTARYETSLNVPVSRSIVMKAARESCRDAYTCLLYTSPSPRDATLSRMPSSA